MGKLSDTHRSLLVDLLLVLITLAAFWRVLGCEFINYDDDRYVTENPHVQAGFTAEGIRWAFTAGLEATWQPAVWLSYMAESAAFHMAPLGYHLDNLLLHTGSVLVLFIVLRRMTRSLWRSAFVAAMFALHPLRVESVAWVAERKDVLSGLFWMLAMWAYVRYTERPGIRRYALVMCTLALGLMSKPALVTLPFVLLLLDYWPLYSMAIRLKPDLVEAHNNLAVALYLMADYAEAWKEIGECRKYGLEPNPGFIQALSKRMPEAAQ